jgi:hypothetical protein
MKRLTRSILIVLFVMVVASGFIYASGTWRHNVTRGLTTGDILYANRTDRLTNLNAGDTGDVVQSTGAATAPAYVAKNLFRQATIHNFATLAASWVLSADELRCMVLATTNANGAATVRLGVTEGNVFWFRNGSGQNNVVEPGTITVATATGVQLVYDSALAAYIKMGTPVVAP